MPLRANGPRPPLYRCLDRLLPHKAALFSHLKQRWKALFQASFEILLYDPDQHPSAALRTGSTGRAVGVGGRSVSGAPARTTFFSCRTPAISVLAHCRATPVPRRAPSPSEFNLVSTPGTRTLRPHARPHPVPSFLKGTRKGGMFSKLPAQSIAVQSIAIDGPTG